MESTFIGSILVSNLACDNNVVILYSYSRKMVCRNHVNIGAMYVAYIKNSGATLFLYVQVFLQHLIYLGAQTI